MRFYSRILRKIPLEIHRKLQRKNLICSDFTLLSQNCVGGVIYNILGLPFNSPTINMFIEDESFVKLVEDPQFYFSKEAYPINDCYVDPLNNNIHYPVIGIEDIEICCLHYTNCEDAIIDWNRRKNRVNYNKILVLANVWNLHDKDEYIERLLKCKYPCIIFTDKNNEGDNFVQLNGSNWYRDERGIIRPNITDFVPGDYHRYFEKYFDYVTWINQNCGV